VGVTAVFAVGCDWITHGNQHGTTPFWGFPGMLIMVLATVVGDVIYTVSGRKIPVVCSGSIVAMFLTSSWRP
jgi:hypothetical protein